MQFKVHAARDIHGVGTAMGDHVRDAEKIRAFRGWAPNLRGLEAAWSAKGGVDRAVRGRVANVIRAQYASSDCQINETALASFAAGAASFTTGHQLVPAGGPAFFHYKIWSAIRWARLFERRTGTPAVPIFWMASEDHDFEEIATLPAALPDGRLGSATWQLNPGGRAVGRLPADDSLLEWSTTWAEAAGWRVEDLATWRDAVRGAKTVAEAMRRWVVALYGAEGLLVIDGDDPVLKAEAHRILEAEWSGQGIGEVAGKETLDLAQAGYPTPVYPRDNMLFLIGENGERKRVLAADLQRPMPRPELLSPNALLRPLYQELLLSNLAMVGGATECAYWFQLRGAFAQHGLQMPVVMLRDSLTLLPEKAFAKSDWSPRLRGGHPNMLIDRWVAEEIRRRLGEQHPEGFEVLSQELAQRARAVDPTLEAAARASVKRMEKEWRRVQRKMRRAIRTQNQAELTAHLESWRWAAPNGVPQERVGNLFQMVSALTEEGTWRDLFEAFLAETCEELEPVWLEGRWPKT